MEAWVFIVILAVMALGIGAGFAIGRSTNTVQRRSEALESEITELRQQMSDYRQQVGEHFTQTADVVNAMTANYRALYDHLSKGAQDLCGEQFTSNKLDSSAMRFIEHSGGAPAGGPSGQAGAAAAAGATAAAGQAVGEAAPSETSREEAEPSHHIADAMEKSAQADREAPKGNGMADDAEAHGQASAGNGELAEESIRPEQAEAAEAPADSEDRSAAASADEGQETGEEPAPSQTVADAGQPKRADSTTLH